MSERVFAYGTLRPSLYEGKAKAFGLVPVPALGVIAKLHGPYKMLHLGGFPGLIEDASFPEVDIIGEVSLVEHLRGLDGYEGYPHLYKRKQVEVKLPDGEVLQDVWVYTFNSYEPGLEKAVVESGDWADVLKKKWS